MENQSTIKKFVQEKYTQIALQDKSVNETSCCGIGCCDTPATAGTYTIMSESYAALPGYEPGADLGLGCGLPTEYAHIQSGDTVLDLGSGAGNDCFVARAEAGPEGKVIGVDFTPAMIKMARQNAERLGFNNVEFREGDIEALPVSDQSVDVIVSNCVLNLAPDKALVFAEIMRTLRPGGHFSISDVVLKGHLPAELVASAEMMAGCVAGALQVDDYLQLIRDAGFENVLVQKQKPILIPDHILLQYLSESALEAFRKAETGIFSITVYAQKPGAGEKKSFIAIGQSEPCCAPGCCN